MTTRFTAFERFIALVGNRYGDPGLPQSEEQNEDYESGVVFLASEQWRLRTARVTPHKPGAFVAVWARDDAGRTCPFGRGEALDGLLVFVREGERFGYFRFPSSQLVTLGVTCSAEHPGKRGFRVYPDWSTNLNRQAARSQAAQSSAFTRLSPTEND